MEHHNRLHSICASSIAMVFALYFSMISPSSANAQDLVTENDFVSGQVQGNNGLLALWKGNPANQDGFSYPGESFLTVEVNGVYYTNNTNIGPGSNPPAINLNIPTVSKITDTIRSVWSEEGFDIVQNVYPVAFSNSGVIVISVKIVNHTATALEVQAQFILDNENSTAKSANDAPYILVDSQLISNWQEYPPNPIPNFFLTDEFAPGSPQVGTNGIGYLNDSSLPSPIGLISLSAVQFGSWPTLQASTWGVVPTTPGSNGDGATLIIGQSSIATVFNTGVSDSVTEIFRTAYGTPPTSLLNASVSTQDNGSVNNQFAIFPNPLTASATLSYSLDTRSSVSISVFDMLGREVAQPVSGVEQDAGNNEVTLDAHNFTPGIYTCRLSVGGQEQMVKVVVTR